MDDDDDDDGGWRTTGTSNLETSLSLGSQTPSSSFGSEYRQSSFCVAPLCLSLSYSPRFREAETVRHRNAAFKNSLQMTQPPSISISKPPKQSISVTKSSLPNVKASRRPKKKETGFKERSYKAKRGPSAPGQTWSLTASGSPRPGRQGNASRLNSHNKYTTTDTVLSRGRRKDE